jgi:polar amino acid transport system permease protein
MSKPMNVILPLPEILRRRSANALPVIRLSWRHGLALTGILLLTSFAADAADSATPAAGVFTVLVRWTPLLLRGFALNIIISILSMAMGTVLGAFLGLGLITPNRPLRGTCWAVTQFFRNAPWLVLLFFMIFILPYHMKIGPFAFVIPDWLKAVIGLGLPVMANVAEIVRGGVQSIPPGQWEAAETLGFTRHQQLWKIILPQSFTRMIPPWMNLYAILTTSTTLASIVGVNEVVSLVAQVLGAEGNRPELLAPLYGYVLLMFFVFTYPVAWATQRLERRTKVRN